MKESERDIRRESMRGEEDKNMLYKIIQKVDCSHKNKRKAGTILQSGRIYQRLQCILCGAYIKGEQLA